MKGIDFMGAGITAILVGIFILIIFGAFKRVPNQKKLKGQFTETNFLTLKGILKVVVLISIIFMFNILLMEKNIY